jgi:hypothetical protein
LFDDSDKEETGDEVEQLVPTLADEMRIRAEKAERLIMWGASRALACAPDIAPMCDQMQVPVKDFRPSVVRCVFGPRGAIGRQPASNPASMRRSNPAQEKAPDNNGTFLQHPFPKSRGELRRGKGVYTSVSILDPVMWVIRANQHETSASNTPGRNEVSDLNFKMQLSINFSAKSFSRPLEWIELSNRG